MDLCGFVWCGSGPVLCCFAVFLLAKRKSGREICGSSLLPSVLFLFVFRWCASVVKPKSSYFLHAFLPLLSLSGPALERDRPQQRKKTLPTQTQKKHPTPCCESLRQQHPKNNIVLWQRLAPWRRRKRPFNQQPCSPESCYSITLAKVLLFGELLSQKKVAAAISFSEP